MAWACGSTPTTAASASQSNYFGGNDSWGLIYEISYNARISGTLSLRNGIVSGPQNKGFPTSAIYISESGGDSRVHSKFSGTLLIADNSFIDNWGGVILWENANRFCSSPTNTSTGACTLVNPAATVQSCNAHNIAHQPYYDDCRWKTQNVSVEHNLFSFRPADIGSSCNCGEFMRSPGPVFRVRDLPHLESLPEDDRREAYNL